MNITPTHINYYHVCHRKLWLFLNGINMESTSDTVYEGKLIGETTYPKRAAKYTQLEIENAKIDFYDPKNKVVHEVKKSDRMETAHEMQVKYYIHLLEQRGLEGVTGLLEYPKLRKTKKIVLSDAERQQFPEWEHEIKKLVHQPEAPGKIKKSFCRKCAYFDFCWVAEDD